MRAWRWMAAATLGAVLCGVRPAAAQTTYSYNPGLGTLPQAQGFVYADENVTTPASVSGGVLHQGPNIPASHEYWARQPASFSYDQGFELTLNLKVLSSGYSNSAAGAGQQTAGYEVVVLDSQSRPFKLGIAADGFFVSNHIDAPVGAGIPFTSFDATSGFHEYKFVVSGGTGRLFVDSVDRGSLAVGADSGIGFGDVVGFGDQSKYDTSQTQLTGFSFTTHTEASAVPEPGALALFLPVLGLLLVQRRRAAASQNC